MEREVSIRNTGQTAIEAIRDSLPSTKEGLQRLVEEENQRHKGMKLRPSFSRRHTLAIILADKAREKVIEGTAWVYIRGGKRIAGTVLEDQDVITYKSFISLAVGMKAIEAFYDERTIDSGILWEWFDEYAKGTVLSRIVSRDGSLVEIKPPNLKRLINVDKKDPSHSILFTDNYRILPDRLRFFLNDETASIQTIRDKPLPLYFALDQNITLPNLQS